MEGIVFVESSQLEQCVEGITIVEGAHLLACSQPHEFIAVTFVAPSGWSHCSSVPRDITASGLHSIAQGLFPDRTICLRRAASPILVSTAPNSIIVPDSAQPFLNETSQIVAISLTWLPRCVVAEPCPDREQIHCEELVRCEKNWVYAIRAKKWDSARAVLLSHARPDLLVRQRDGGGETPLAWAAYGAGSCRAAADLVHLILKAAPGEAAVVCPGTGFTPLHDAAWGNAAAEVAALLCLFYPEALFARGRSGETPHTVGRSMHLGFSWPRPAELLAAAASLLWRRGAEALGAPAGTAERLERCLAAVCGRQHRDDRDDRALPRAPAPAAAAPEPGAAALRRAPRRRAAASVAQAPRGEDADCAPSPPLAADVLHFCEARAKSRGRLAGAREVRHSRCGFTEQAVVAVGGAGCTFRLRLYRVRAIHEAPARRERALERSIKLAVGVDLEVSLCARCLAAPAAPPPPFSSASGAAAWRPPGGGAAGRRAARQPVRRARPGARRRGVGRAAGLPEARREASPGRAGHGRRRGLPGGRVGLQGAVGCGGATALGRRGCRAPRGRGRGVRRPRARLLLGLAGPEALRRWRRRLRRRVGRAARGRGPGRGPPSARPEAAARAARGAGAVRLGGGVVGGPAGRARRQEGCRRLRGGRRLRRALGGAHAAVGAAADAGGRALPPVRDGPGAAPHRGPLRRPGLQPRRPRLAQGQGRGRRRRYHGVLLGRQGRPRAVRVVGRPRGRRRHGLRLRPQRGPGRAAAFGLAAAGVGASGPVAAGDAGAGFRGRAFAGGRRRRGGGGGARRAASVLGGGGTRAPRGSARTKWAPKEWVQCPTAVPAPLEEDSLSAPP
ncbi:unnamed protein product, partial [Prorocentrum cordatum]